MANVYIDEEIAKALADIDDFNFDDNFVNQIWLEVINTEKESGGRNGDLLSETLTGDGGNVELALAESIVGEKKVEGDGDVLSETPNGGNEVED